MSQTATMTLVQTHTLKGTALNWAMAQVLGPDSDAARHYEDDQNGEGWEPSTNPAQGHALIFDAGISLINWRLKGEHSESWWATSGDPRDEETMGATGSTPLEAGIRCRVVDHFGDEMDVPEHLLVETNENTQRMR